MGTKMFKIGSFEEELFAGMAKSLVSSQLENKHSLDKLSKAADYINTAAELLDDTGFKVEADMLTKVLKRLAQEQDADDNSVSDLTDEEIEALTDPREPSHPGEIIVEPLEQEIEVAPTVQESGKHPLAVDFRSGEIFEEKPEMLEFQSIANKLAAKLAKKKV